MSIPFADALPATLPTTSVSTLEPDLHPIGPVLLTISIAWLALSIGLCRFLGIVRRRSIVGPSRLDTGETIYLLLFIFFLAIWVAILLSMMLNRFVRSDGELRLLLQTANMEVPAIFLVLLITVKLRVRGLARLGLQPVQIWHGLFTGLLAIFILFPIVAITSDITALLFQWAHLPAPAPHQVLQALGASHDKRLIALAIFVAVAVAPVFEELAFRGFLQTILSRFFETILPNSPGAGSSGQKTDRQGARWIAVIISAIIFALIHGVPAFIPPLFVLGLGLGYTYERTGNLWASMTMHAAFNSLQIVLFLSMYGN